MIAERPRFWIQVESLDDDPHAGRRLARVLKGLLREFDFRCLAVAEDVTSIQQAEAENDARTN
jgi:hypothetical protein